MNDLERGIGTVATVGASIIRLFPKGFLIDSYTSRHAVVLALDVEEGKSISAEYAEQSWSYYSFDRAKDSWEYSRNQEKTITQKLDGLVAEKIQRNSLILSGRTTIPHDEKFDYRCSRYLNSIDKRYEVSSENWKRKLLHPVTETTRVTKKQFSDCFLTIPYTPFDMFAVVALLLRDSGAYHHIEPECQRGLVDGVDGRLLTLTTIEQRALHSIGDHWRFCGNPRDLQDDLDPNWNGELGLPAQVLDLWAELLASWKYPVFKPVGSSSGCPHWWIYAYQLLVISDRAARDTGLYPSVDSGEDESNDYEGVRKGGYWCYFSALSFLSKAHPRIEPGLRHFQKEMKIGEFDIINLDVPQINTVSAALRDAVCVMPKSRTAQIGCTLRSLSHNLSLLPARGLVRANWVCQAPGRLPIPDLEKRPFNLLVIPYPFKIDANQFKIAGRVNHHHKHGSFEVTPSSTSDEEILAYVKDLLTSAKSEVGCVDGIVFPELSLSAYQFDSIYRYLKIDTDVELLCAGLNQKYPEASAGKVSKETEYESDNIAVMCSFKERSNDVDEEGEQSTVREAVFCSYQKHHRWKMDSDQLKMYGLTSALDPSVTWWEDRRINSRKLSFMVMRNLWSMTTLVCEDLARVDPAQQIVRAVGPNLILALLLDGPQIKNRWPARYATVLAEDPGSAVLSVSSIGLIRRSEQTRFREKGIEPTDRSIALWRDDTGQLTNISIGLDQHAAVLTLYEYTTNEITMDGRRNAHNSISLRLGNYFPLKLNEKRRDAPDVAL